MDIRNDLQGVQQLLGGAKVSGGEKGAEAQSATGYPATASDQASLSAAASMASRVASLPDVRAEKVAAVQGALASGSYNVSSSDVARSLMGHMLEDRE